jgi:HAD superfamily hydrolase (TIGR01450 family)
MWVLDLDGVIWLGDQPLAGAAAAVAALRAAGEQVLFATNNSSAVVAAQEAKLARMGIPAEDSVVTSAMAAAGLVEPGERALVCGGPGIVEALEARGAKVLDAGDVARREVRPGEPVDVVVVGFHRSFDYERMRVAAQALGAGARFLATNDDATYPTPEGEIPGGGAIAAGIAYASGLQPVVAGKPHPPMAALIHARADRHDEGPNQGIVVGDRPETDGAFAATLGYRFGLVLSGVTRSEDLPVEPTPGLVAPDLHHLVLASLRP